MAASLTLAVLTLLTTGSGLSGGAPGPEQATIASDTRENPVSVGSGIPIRSNRASARERPTPVYSIRMKDLASAERVRISASTYASFCALSDNGISRGNDGTPCRGETPRGQDYRVKLEMHVFAASSPGQTSSPTTPYLGRVATECDENIHHCPMDGVFNPRLRHRSKPFVNVDVSAWRVGGPPLVAGRKDLVELEADCNQRSGSASYQHCHPTAANRPDPQDPTTLKTSKGWLSVIRFGPNYGDPEPDIPEPLETSTIKSPTVIVETKSEHQTPAPGPEVVSSFRFDDLQPGDIVEARARPRIVGRNFDHSVSAWWLLSLDPSAATASASAPADRYVSASHGTNCLGPKSKLNSLRSGRCHLETIGALRVPPSASSGQTMYLNYVVAASDGHVKDARGQDANEQHPPTTPTPTPTATVKRSSSGSTFQLGCQPTTEPPTCAIPSE